MERSAPQSDTQNTPAMPSDAELVMLVNESMFGLVKAVSAQDFQIYYDSISQLWKSQITEKEFGELFQQFIDQKLDLTFVGRTQPVFNLKPTIDENGILFLKGSYPSGERMATFEFKYIYEYPYWKLMGINVNAN